MRNFNFAKSAVFTKLTEGENEMVKAPKTLIVSFCIVIALFALAILLSPMRVCRDDVSNDGNGADAARNELGTARSELEEQRRILDDAQSAVADSERAADEIARITKDDARIIEECRSILESVRKRASAQTED